MTPAEQSGGKDAPGCIRSRVVHDGRVVKLAVDTVRFPDGSTGELEMIRHSGAAAVLPVLDGDGSADPLLLLLRQYRYAAGGYLYEVPAGRPAYPGEPWERCARRELEEETGMRATTLHPLTTIYTTPGFTDEQIHLFVATDLVPGSEKLDRDEFLETVPLRLSEALQMVERGDLRDAKTICTLLYAARYSLPRGR